MVLGLIIGLLQEAIHSYDFMYAPIYHIHNDFKKSPQGILVRATDGSSGYSGAVFGFESNQGTSIKVTDGSSVGSSGYSGYSNN